jgi:hypothetical protein
MTLPATVIDRLSSPTPDSLWRLRGDLLERGVPPDASVFPVLDAFWGYLDALATSSSSREYSHLASLLDISAVSGVILENLTGGPGGNDLAVRLISSVLSEGLMVLATRQHVKAWEGELDAVHRAAALALYVPLWRWTAARTAALPPAERRALLDRLLAPAIDPATGGLAKAALLGRVFQILLAGLLEHEAAS